MTNIIISTIGAVNALPFWPERLLLNPLFMDELGLPYYPTSEVERLGDELYESHSCKSFYYLYFRFSSMPEGLAYKTRFGIDSHDETDWASLNSGFAVCDLVEKRTVTTAIWVGVESVSR